MKKVDIKGLCDEFRAQMSELKAFRSDVSGVLASHARQASHESKLAELVFHRAYVLLEEFVSEYFIGCVNCQSACYLRFRRNALMQSVETKFTQWDATHTQYSPPKNIPVSEVRALLNARNKNITFNDYNEMEQRAQEWLAPVYSAKVAGVTQDRKQILDVAKKVRNCIAHNSLASFTEMNQMIVSLPQVGSLALLRRANSVISVGAYLKAAQPGINSRVEFFLDEFDDFAGQIA